MHLNTEVVILEKRSFGGSAHLVGNYIMVDGEHVLPQTRMLRKRKMGIHRIISSAVDINAFLPTSAA